MGVFFERTSREQRLDTKRLAFHAGTPKATSVCRHFSEHVNIPCVLHDIFPSVAHNFFMLLLKRAFIIKKANKNERNCIFLGFSSPANR